MPDGLAPNPNPDPTAPPAGVVAPMAPNAPITPGGVTLPPPLAAMAPAPPPPPTPSPAAVAQNAKHNVMGQVAQALLGGGHTTYQVDPNTNQVVPVQQPNKPGNLWRQIVGGVIMGGMAGAETPVGHSPLEAAFRGAGAAQAYGQQQDRESFARANEQSKTQIESKKLDLEQQRVQAEIKYQEAMIAHQTQANLLAQATFDLSSRKYIDETNEIQEQREAGLQESGATKIPIIINGKDVNGQMGNGADMMKAVTTDPSLGRNPLGKDGMPVAYRMHTQHVDLTGLHQELGKGWVDDKGNPVDLAARTTNAVYDVPIDVMKRRSQLTNKEINKLAGYRVAPDNDDQTSLTTGEVGGLQDRALKMQHEKDADARERQRLGIETQNLQLRKEELKDAKAGKQGELVLTHVQNISRLWESYLKEDEAAAQSGTDPDAAAHVREDRQMLDQNNKLLQTYLSTGKIDLGNKDLKENPPKTWADINSQPLGYKQKIQMAATTKIPIPYAELERMAADSGGKVLAEDLAKAATAAGAIVDQGGRSAAPPTTGLTENPTVGQILVPNAMKPNYSQKTNPEDIQPQY